MLAVVVVAAWFVLAVGAALIVGSGIRVADRRDRVNTDNVDELSGPLFVEHILRARTASSPN